MSINNPPPADGTGATIIQVEKHGECLWNIAMGEVRNKNPQLSGNDLTKATASELRAIEKANRQIKNPDLIYVGDKVAIPGDQSTQTQGGDQPPQTQGGNQSTQTDSKVAAIQTAADQGNASKVEQLIAAYVGNANSAGAAQAFKTLMQHDWGTSSSLVKEQIFQAVVATLMNSPFNNKDTLKYIEGYLSSLPSSERRDVADRLSKQHWPLAMIGSTIPDLLSAARRDLSIP